MCKTCMLKTMKRWNKLKKTQVNGKAAHVHELEDLILRWLYSSNCSIGSTQSLSLS